MTATGKIVAAVDIGTNSVKMTIARKNATGGIETLADRTEITRLGKNVDASGRLNADSVIKTLAALQRFAEEARTLNVTETRAVGTSALRDAANGPGFVRDAQAVLGGTVEVITGAREASLTFAAARRDPELQALAPSGAVWATSDIGGGSTEISLGRDETNLTFQQSLQLGAVRVTERALINSDPPTREALTRAKQIAADALAVVPTPVAGETVVAVGSGGTIANLASMERGIAVTSPDFSVAGLHGVRLDLAAIDARIARLASQTIAERRETPGLEPDRADVILAGAIIQAAVLRRLGVTSVLVSVRGLRFGLAFEMLG